MTVAYMICTTPRTGATALLDTLRRCGVAGDPREHPDGRWRGDIFGTMVQWGQMTLEPPVRLPQADRRLFIFLRRRDVLAQAVSWIMARQTGRWHSTSPPAPTTPVYNADIISGTIDRIRHDNAAWHDWLTGKNQLELVYEEMAADYPATVRRILEAIGVDGGLPIEGPRLTRLSDERNERWMRRWQEERG